MTVPDDVKIVVTLELAGAPRSYVAVAGTREDMGDPKFWDRISRAIVESLDRSPG